MCWLHGFRGHSVLVAWFQNIQCTNGLVSDCTVCCLVSLSHLSPNCEGCWGTTDYFATSFLHLSLFSTALWVLANSRPSIPWCCPPTSSSVCIVFFPLSLCLARWFWPDLMNGRHDHTTAVCISLQWSGGLRVVQLPAGSWVSFTMHNMFVSWFQNAQCTCSRVSDYKVCCLVSESTLCL